MGRSHQVLTPSLSRALRALGQQIRLARLRRQFSAQQVADRTGLSLPTLRGIEKGAPGVAIGAYARVLMVLGLEKDLMVIAKDDELGRRLQDENLSVKQRAPKRSL